MTVTTTTSPPTSPRQVRSPRGALLGVTGAGVAVAVALALLGFAGQLTPEVEPGLPVPGTATQAGLPIATALRDIATAIALGSLLMLCWSLPARTRAKPSSDEAVWLRVTSLAAMAGWAWSGAAAAVFVFAYSDLAAVPLSEPMLWSSLTSFATEFELGRYLALNLGAALIVAIGASMARTTGGIAVVATVGVVGLWPVALTGHAAGSLNHDIAVTAQMFHLLGLSVWLGGLVALLVVAGMREVGLAAAVRHYSTLALWGFGLTAGSGLVNALLRVDAWSQLATTYGLALLTKVLLLAALAAAGLAQRRAAIGRLEAGRPRTFLRVAVLEVLTMAAAAGLGVALGRMQPPNGLNPAPLQTVESLIYYRLPGPLDWPGWVTTWRLDPLWAPVAVGAVVWYLVAAVRLRRRGDTWSWGRTAAWVIGWALLLWSTSGSPGVYGKVMFSMHMVQHMSIATGVPVFLVLGAPVTLLLRSTPARRDGTWGAREWTLRIVRSPVSQILGNPLVAAAFFVGSLVVFYSSGLFELSLRSHTGHVVMVIHFLVAGYLFANAVVGVDPGPQRPAYPMRALLVMMVFGYHAFFSVSLMARSTVMAADWFRLVGPDWVSSLAEDQYLGASIGWALGDYPLAVIAGALLWQWVRADHAEQRRHDRQADRDGDAQLASYNAYLQSLARSEDSPRR